MAVWSASVAAKYSFVPSLVKTSLPKSRKHGRFPFRAFRTRNLWLHALQAPLAPETFPSVGENEFRQAGHVTCTSLFTALRMNPHDGHETFTCGFRLGLALWPTTREGNKSTGR